MGLFEKAKRLFSSGSSVSDSAVIWAFDVAADQKPIDEYDLIVMLSPETDLPIFIHVEEEIYIPEGTLAYRSTDDDWAMEINDDTVVPAIPCKLIPPSQTEEIDTSRPNVIEVPDKLTGGKIPASADKADDLGRDGLRKMM